MTFEVHKDKTRWRAVVGDQNLVAKQKTTGELQVETIQYLPDTSGEISVLKQFYLQAKDITIPAGETWVIPSGMEYNATKVTVNGRLVVKGVLEVV